MTGYERSSHSSTKMDGERFRMFWRVRVTNTICEGLHFVQIEVFIQHPAFFGIEDVGQAFIDWSSYRDCRKKLEQMWKVMAKVVPW